MPFCEIGKKIKVLAQILFWTECVIAYLIAFGMFVGGYATHTYGLWLVSPAVMIVAPIVFWAANFFMYGFGELIDKTVQIEKHVRPQSAEEEDAE